MTANTGAAADLPAVVAICGPTAAGKARLGRAVAARLGTAVNVCDSVKVYRGLDVGSAKPDGAARRQVRHELLDLVDPDEVFSAGDYAHAAWRRIRAGDRLFVGGTGFYLRSVVVAPSPMPGADVPASEPRRAVFEAAWRAREATTPGSAHRALAAVDPATAAAIDPRNVVRVLRALFLCEAAGGPISEIRGRSPPRPRARLLTVVLDPGVEAVDRAIERRVTRMREAGFLEEVEKLHAAGYHRGHKAMTSLGYRQLLDAVEGRCTVDEAFADVIVRTRKFARRQRAYLRTQLPGEVIHIASPREFPWRRVEALLGREGS